MDLICLYATLNTLRWVKVLCVNWIVIIQIRARQIYHSANNYCPTDISLLVQTVTKMNGRNAENDAWGWFWIGVLAEFVQQVDKIPMITFTKLIQVNLKLKIIFNLFRSHRWTYCSLMKWSWRMFTYVHFISTFKPKKKKTCYFWHFAHC